MSVPTIFITGPVGVGKTIVASDVSWLAEAARIPHGGLDVDAVTWMHPDPPAGLGYENTGAVWESYWRAGATHLILTQVIYSRADLDGFRSAVPGADITVFRLRADLETLLARIAERERGGLGEGSTAARLRSSFSRWKMPAWRITWSRPLGARRTRSPPRSSSSPAGVSARSSRAGARAARRRAARPAGTR